MTWNRKQPFFFRTCAVASTTLGPKESAEVGNQQAQLTIGLVSGEQSKFVRRVVSLVL